MWADDDFIAINTVLGNLAECLACPKFLADAAADPFVREVLLIDVQAARIAMHRMMDAIGE